MNRLCTRCKIAYPPEYFRLRSSRMCIGCEPPGKTKGPKALAHYQKRQEYFRWLVKRDGAKLAADASPQPPSAASPQDADGPLP